MLKMIRFALSALLVLCLTNPPSYAQLFSISSNGAPATCDLSKDWCIDVRPDNSIGADTMATAVGKTVGYVNGTPTYESGYRTLLTHSSQPFYNGIWLTPEAVKQFKVTSADLRITAIKDMNGMQHPLSNCVYRGYFPNLTIPRPGVAAYLVIHRSYDTLLGHFDYSCRVIPV